MSAPPRGTATETSPARTVREVASSGDVPLHVNPEWAAEHPWLVQGTTGRGGADTPFDLGLAGGVPVGEALDRWRTLTRATGMSAAAHSHQVHGTALLVHPPSTPGLHVSRGYDGHATMAAGLLLTVSVADCVPIFLLDAGRRAVAVLHGGWRGVAGGVLERGVAALGDVAGSAPIDLRVHFGPAICGRCYEVGPEVHLALGLPEPATNTPVDLRRELARRALALGVERDHVTISEHCTLCGGGTFFSHRGGDRGRQMGALGVRP